MQRVLFFIYFVLFVLSALFTSCSQSEDEQEEKGQIEQMTDEIADEAVDMVHSPLQKARAVKKLGDQRTNRADDLLDE